MASALLSAARAFRAVLTAFDPALLTGADGAALAEELARTEKACAYARARAAARAAECGAHQGRGYADAAEWLARLSGSTQRDAKDALETVKALGHCPKTEAALGEGELSLSQAREITRTESECPGSEEDLVEGAKAEDLSKLRDRGRKKRLEATDPDDLHRRQRRQRELRHWLDESGMVRGTFNLMPEVGVPFCNRLDAETDRLFRQARAEGRTEPREA